MLPTIVSAFTFSLWSSICFLSLSSIDPADMTLNLDKSPISGLNVVYSTFLGSLLKTFLVLPNLSNTLDSAKYSSILSFVPAYSKILGLSVNSD